MITSLATMRQIVISHLEKSSGYELSHYMELINLWVETLIEFGFSVGEIKIQLSIIYNSFKDETICTSIKFFLNDSERLN